MSVSVTQEEEIGAWQTPVCPGQASGATGEGIQPLPNRLPELLECSVSLKITLA